MAANKEESLHFQNWTRRFKTFLDGSHYWPSFPAKTNPHVKNLEASEKIQIHNQEITLLPCYGKQGREKIQCGFGTWKLDLRVHNKVLNTSGMVGFPAIQKCWDGTPSWVSGQDESGSGPGHDWSIHQPELFVYNKFVLKMTCGRHMLS